MQYKKVRRKKVVAQKLKAVDILYQKMMFYETRAMTIAAEIVKKLKEDDKARGDKLAEMFKHMMRFNDIVIECATKLAPYQSPKLESVEVKQKIEHRYVVRTPMQMPDQSQWLKAVQAQALPPPKFNASKEDDEPVRVVNGEIIEPDYETDGLGLNNG